MVAWKKHPRRSSWRSRSTRTTPGPWAWELSWLRTMAQEESLMAAYLEIKAGDRKVGVVTLEHVREGLFLNPRRILVGALCYMLLHHPEEAVSLMREGAARGVDSPMLYAEL